LLATPHPATTIRDRKYDRVIVHTQDADCIFVERFFGRATSRESASYPTDIVLNNEVALLLTEQKMVPEQKRIGR